MHITEILKPSSLKIPLQATDKSALLAELVDLIAESGCLADKDQFYQDILAREAIDSTGFENGIAIPHAKSKAVQKPCIAFGISPEGVDFQSIDGKKAHIFFMLAFGETSNNEHLGILSQIASMMIEDGIREKLLQIKTYEELLTIIEQYTSKKHQGSSDVAVSNKGKILAVTACPTGIAHTYMAAEAMSKAASIKGIDFKVETNGSVGVRNELTIKEIAEAQCIVIAAGKEVEMERFAGKPVLSVSLKQAIHHADEVLDQALTSKIPLYQIKKKPRTGGHKYKGSGLYQHIMSGVSQMLPFVVAGGILIALSFMFGIEAANPANPQYHPFAKFLSDLGGGGAFFLMIPVLAGFIGMSIGERPAFMPAMVGGLMANQQGAGFLGGLIAGLLAGYVIRLLKRMTQFLPAAWDSTRPILIYPLFGLLITGALLQFTILPVAVSINTGLTQWLAGLNATNLIILGIILGGMMAADMGGPINKVAFTFGIAMIQAKNYAPHAAVMAGGMVPPFAIALATTLFKNKFTIEERRSGATNYIMGAAFITEGAIPFVASDLFRVLPSCIVGAAVAGGMAMAFGCRLPAPHGGIFVMPLVTNWPLYIVSILAGSLLSALLIGLSKPTIDSKIRSNF